MKYTRFIPEYPEALDWKLSGGVAIIVDCSRDTTIVEIPDIIEGRPVTELAEYAFENCNFLISVTIPKSVKIIGSECFAGCVYLTKIELPHSITTIGEKAFDNCKRLKKMWLSKELYETHEHILRNLDCEFIFTPTTRGKLRSSVDQKFILGNGNSSTIEEIIEDIKVSKNFDELLQAISGCEDDILDNQLQDVYEECRDGYNIKTCKEMLLDVIDEYRHNWNI